MIAGLVLAHAHPWKYGAGHSCPYGASRTACSYPPDLGRQRATWATEGAALGLLTAGGVLGLDALRRRTVRR